MSSDLDGLDLYKIGVNGELSYVRSYQGESRVLQASYDVKERTLAYLDDVGVHFIKLNNGILNKEISPFSVAYSGGNSFSHFNF